MEGACRTSRAAIWLARGRVDEAVAEAHLGTELARPAKDAQSINPALTFEAFALLAQGDRAAAAALADELVEAWRDVGIVHPNECADAPWIFIDRTGDELGGARRGLYPGTGGALRDRGDLVGQRTCTQISSVPDEATRDCGRGRSFRGGGPRRMRSRARAARLRPARRGSLVAKGEALLAVAESA
jgi:hypothetical protein